MSSRMQAYWTMKDLTVYHMCKNCPVGSDTEPENLGSGPWAPQGARRCPACATLEDEGECMIGVP